MTGTSASTNAALLNRALELHRAGRLDDAGAIYEQLLAESPEHADAAHLLGLVRFRNDDIDSAIRLIRDAIEHDPDNPIFHANLGNVLKEAAQLTDAIAAYRRALALHPGYAEVHNNLGHALQASGMIGEGIDHYRKAIALRPADYRAYFNLGNACFQIGASEEAIAAFREATRLDPEFAPAWDHLGNVLQRLGRHAEAETCFRRWIRIDLGSADAFLALALALQAQDLFAEASDCYRRAIALRPDFLPTMASALWLGQRLCDWTATAAYSERVLRRAAEPGGPSPFQLTSLPGASRAILLAAARSHAATIAPTEPMRHGIARFGKPARMRVGYLSSDLHGHPVAYLSAEVFELHDRDRFEVFLFSYGPDDGSTMRQRLKAGCDHFIDIASLSDEAAAQRIYDERIQVLIDLKGYTADDRPQIAAYRPAPIQVNWLGFPGSMGADWIDYLIADPCVIPPEHDRDYSEKVARLPHCYQPNDRKRPSGIAGLSRRACGLAETDFVFCCFNQSYKIEPAMFALWMRLLSAVPGSVLWLLEEKRAVKENLRREAIGHGVSPERLVFAPVRPLPEHLARYALADLALDTFPYTSHTTGSDALWAGCPIATVMGDTFASRVAASLLLNVGLGQLIASSCAEYEALALDLARDRPRLEALRRHLHEGRATAPLFDSPRFTKNLEVAYRRMWMQFAQGNAPQAFSVREE